MNFDEVAKLGKASEDTDNRRECQILYELLNKWVAEGVDFDPHDFTLDAVYYNTNVFISLLRLAQVLLNSPLTMEPKLFLELARIHMLLALFAKCVILFKS